jgi:hypothetical protein
MALRQQGHACFESSHAAQDACDTWMSTVCMHMTDRLLLLLLCLAQAGSHDGVGHSCC